MVLVDCFLSLALGVASRDFDLLADVTFEGDIPLDLVDILLPLLGFLALLNPVKCHQV